MTPSVLDSIPAVNGAADRGCLDQPGVLHAPARDWYPGGDGSLALNGAARIAVGWSDPFQAAAEAAVQAVAPAFVRGSGFEYRASADGCATHRYAEFHSGDDDIVIAAWRVESAANPFWVPNEADFTTLNETTLMSQGSHIVVVLVVAPDGTTARVSAYGARAEALVSGWPTTAVPRPDAPEPGPTNFDVEQLVPIAQAALDQVTGAR